MTIKKTERGILAIIDDYKDIIIEIDMDKDSSSEIILKHNINNSIDLYSYAVDIAFDLFDKKNKIDDFIENLGSILSNKMYVLIEYLESKLKDLYFIASSCGNMVKIGFSNQVDKRFVTLKKNTPFNIDMIKYIEGAGIYEKDIHRLFKKKNIKFDMKFDGSTEWFHLDDKVKSFIKDISIEKLDKKYGSNKAKSRKTKDKVH